jgi:hypothetical protein
MSDHTSNYNEGSDVAPYGITRLTAFQVQARMKEWRNRSKTLNNLILDPLLDNDLETTPAARQQILNIQVYAAITE